jgi:NAD(P)-dependent dehydrogenase (short-subunit alcohol dehydrogenase family)
MLTGMEPPSPEMTSSLAISRVADPAEIAEAIAFLATPAASYVTGAVLDANGGYTA